MSTPLPPLHTASAAQIFGHRRVSAVGYTLRTYIIIIDVFAPPFFFCILKLLYAL